MLYMGPLQHPPTCRGSSHAPQLQGSRPYGSIEGRGHTSAHRHTLARTLSPPVHAARTAMDGHERMQKSLVMLQEPARALRGAPKGNLCLSIKTRVWKTVPF